MKQSISKTAVDALMKAAHEKGRTLYCYDNKLTGFGVYATKAGKASYFVQYRTGGRETPSKRLTIARHGVVTAEQARALARTEILKAGTGVDLVEAKKSRRRDQTGDTFKDVVERYLSLNGQKNASWPETRRLIEREAMPALGNKPLKLIQRGDVGAIIDKTMVRSPAVARALFAAIRPFFKWANDRGAIDINPIAGFRGPPPLSSRERTLDHEEIKAFWAGAGLLGWPFAQVFHLLLLTGQRREEVAGMWWQELRLDRRIWRLPPKTEFQPRRTKNGREHIVDLSPQAVAILEALPVERKGLVFTTTGLTPVSGFSKAKRRLDTYMRSIMESRFNRALVPWRVHDLRRTMSTLMGEDLRVGSDVIERIQNHARTGIKGVYQQQDHREPRLAALMDWGAYLEELVSVEPLLGADLGK